MKDFNSKHLLPLYCTAWQDIHILIYLIFAWLLAGFARFASIEQGFFLSITEWIRQALADPDLQEGGTKFLTKIW